MEASMNTVLALVTESEATKNDLCNQLSAILEDYMSIVGYATESGVDQLIRADLVVFSSMEMYEIARELVDPECPVIVAKRSLNMAHLDQLFNIPNQTTVLVVNDLIENAREIIKLLTEVGVDHLRYQAYAPGCEYDSTIQYAITPAEVALIPPKIPNKIDLGARIIDISTVIEILTRLNLLDEKAHYISAKYVETIIRLNKRLHDHAEETNRSNRYLYKVLNHVNDGLIAFDQHEKITVFNETCEAIFGIRSTRAIGRPLSNLIREPSIYKFLTQTQAQDEMVGKIGDNQYVIGKMAIDPLKSYVCTFKNTKDTFDMEKKLRQMMTKRGHVAKYQLDHIVGQSDVIKNCIETAKKLATTDLSLLIQGESGVGKEIFASAIHNASPRANGPFLAINFSALPEELAESELFGYEEGAFTGAKKGGKKGLFEEANGGTIFLDEIGDISPRIQARLLRVLQEKEIRRVGGAEIISINVRVIAATHRDLKQMCHDGAFREDLYHRLRKLYLRIPPLRERIDDLNPLIDYFSTSSGNRSLKMSPEVMSRLSRYSWSGNVRELQNLIEYLQVVCEEGVVNWSDLPEDYLALLNDEHASLQPSDSKSFAWVDESQHQDAFLLTKEDVLILRIIESQMKQGQCIGRNLISKMASEVMPSLTPNRVRKRMDWLEMNGLIAKGVGRAGTHLTELGRETIKNQRS